MPKQNNMDQQGQAGGQSSKGPGRGWHGDPEGHRRAGRTKKNKQGQINQGR